MHALRCAGPRAGVTAELACREKWLAQATFAGRTGKSGLALYSRLYGVAQKECNDFDP